MKWLDSLNVKESYQVPDALMAVLADRQKREALFDLYLSEFSLSDDPVNLLFQTEHGDTDRFKQDFTPPELANLLSRLPADGHERIADICCGTGSLALQCARRFPHAFYHCEEVTERAIPFLLLNLAIRNLNAEVVLGDVLTQEAKRCWRLLPGERFSEITEIAAPSHGKYDLVVSNPPFSLRWEPFMSDRWYWGTAPKKAADYAFIETGISMLADGGEAYFIVPHGVLFRGQAEAEIRKNLAGRLTHVIGVPQNLFVATSIPVCILGYAEHRIEDRIVFVDGSKHFEKVKNLNHLRECDIQAILDAVKSETPKLSHIATMAELQKNDFNLNIPRYVDTVDEIQLPPLADVLDDLADAKARARESEQKLLGMLRELSGLTKREREAIEKCFA